MSLSSSSDGGSAIDFHRIAPSISVAGKADFVFDTVSQIDQDEELAFQLRGHSINPLVDAAMPLFGLVMRLRKLHAHENVHALLVMVRDQVLAIDEEIRQHTYDSATLLAYRYALCSFVDDAVLSTTWGRHSAWSARSLLSIFHNETWGGEKFFTVLSRMQMEPEKYRDVLEFKYLCLCLGFRGKYGVEHNQAEALNAIIVRLHRALRQLRGDPPDALTDAQVNIVTKRYRIGQQLPLWMPWAVVAVLLTGIYALFAFNLGNTTDLVLHSLDGVLKP